MWKPGTFSITCFKPASFLNAKKHISSLNLFLDFGLRELFSQDRHLDVGSDGVERRVLTIPDVRSSIGSGVYFIQLSLSTAEGKVVSSNFYWLSSKKSELDWDNTIQEISTPISSYEDLTELMSLPKTRLKTTARLLKGGASVQVWLKNASPNLAFQVRLAVERDGPNSEVLPVFWDDNYISLLPGEERMVEARFVSKHSIGPHPTLRVTGWNIEQEVVALQ
jgi:exo-1,4-beta-D-glucosaminidase